VHVVTGADHPAVPDRRLPRVVGAEPLDRHPGMVAEPDWLAVLVAASLTG
jgi:hypothetical protein